jgi:YHS domain-containing protein
MNRIVASVSMTAALFVLGCHNSHEEQSANTPPTAVQAQTSAVDLHNTVCPVSGEKVESSKLTEAYDGKIYHLCCNDCTKDFKKDPKKYADAVAADPAKYGVK